MIEEIIEILPILLPLLAIELGMRIYAVIDIHKKSRETLLVSKTAWTVIVLLISFGWVVYLLAGRKDKVIID